jgi:hypothetical protein
MEIDMVVVEAGTVEIEATEEVKDEEEIAEDKAVLEAEVEAVAMVAKETRDQNSILTSIVFVARNKAMTSTTVGPLPKKERP